MLFQLPRAGVSKDALGKWSAVVMQGQMVLDPRYRPVQQTDRLDVSHMFVAFPDPDQMTPQYDTDLQSAIRLSIAAACSQELQQRSGRTKNPVLVFAGCGCDALRSIDRHEQPAYKALLKYRILEALEKVPHLSAKVVGFDDAQFSRPVQDVWRRWTSGNWEPPQVEHLEHPPNVEFSNGDPLDLANTLACAGENVVLVVGTSVREGIGCAALSNNFDDPAGRDMTFLCRAHTNAGICRRSNVLDAVLRLQWDVVNCRMDKNVWDTIQQVVACLEQGDFRRAMYSDMCLRMRAFLRQVMVSEQPVLRVLQDASIKPVVVDGVSGVSTHQGKSSATYQRRS